MCCLCLSAPSVGVYVCVCVFCCRPSTKAKAAPEEAVLSASAAGLMAAVAETLAKLLMHQRAWLRHYPQHSPPANAAGQASSAGESHGAAAAGPAAAQPVQLPPDSQQAQARLLQSALALLLQLQFHPATASLTEVCQRLSVFFDVFSAASEANQLQLAAACLPAARQALHLKTKRHPAPLLAKYVLQLLQQARLRQEQQDAAGDGGSKPTRSGRHAWRFVPPLPALTIHLSVLPCLHFQRKPGLCTTPCFVRNTNLLQRDSPDCDCGSPCVRPLTYLHGSSSSDSP